ncbi:MAG: hypothetical protein SPL64_04575 [Bacteroidaceae bacterium]|jgi:hypothetical protein|nr:hypothetical protein [Bacteroidaceae bacterium]
MKATMYFESTKSNASRTSYRTLRRNLLQSNALKKLSAMMSDMLEQPISPIQALKIVHAEVAFTSLLLFCSASFWATAALTVWSLAALADSKRAMSPKA